MAVSEQERLDRLRRRLYRADASEEDRRRYEELRRRLVPAPPAQETEDLPPARPRRRRLLPVVPVVAVLVAGVAAAALSVPGPAPRPGAVSPAPSARPHPDPSRATPVAVSVQGVRTAALRFHGVGPAVVPLLEADAPSEGGRLVVVLASDGDAPLGWAAARWSSDGDGPSTVEVVARSARRPRGALGHPESARYDGDPPIDIAVSDPGSHPWTLTVALLERGAPPAR